MVTFNALVGGSPSSRRVGLRRVHHSCAALLCALSGSALLPKTAHAQAVTIVQTNADQSALLAPQPSISFASQSELPLTIRVDDGVRYQQMDGFGASFTDSSAWLVQTQLSPLAREQLMTDLFGADGIHLSFLRQPMGTSDLALSNYTYDDLPSGSTDPRMHGFTIDHDRAYVIPVLRQALALNPNATVMALPWSPPAWMKTNGSLQGGGFDARYYDALARYFVQFIQRYAAVGIPVHYVAAQNEPLFGGWGYPDEESHAYATEFLSVGQEARFIGQYLGPALRHSWLGTRILGYEHNWDNPLYALSLLQNSEASRYLAGVSFHCYAGDRDAAQGSVRQLFPDKGIWFTECTGTTGSPVFGDNLGWNMHNLLIGSVRDWARSVSLWNMALDQNSGPTNGEGCKNCRGVVTIDTSTSPPSVRREVEYYSLGHAAKYVEPGAYRIDSNLAGPVENVAFKNPDGSIALLAYNSASAPSTFSVRWDDRVFPFTLPAGAVATFKWQTVSHRDFDVAVSPGATTVSQGAAADIKLAIPRYGYGKGVSLSVTGLPTGARALISDRDCSAGHEWSWRHDGADPRAAFDELGDFGDSDRFSKQRPFGEELRTIHVTTDGSTPVGTYPLTITGKSGGKTHTTSAQLVVNPKRTPFGNGVAPWPIPGRIEVENFDAGGEGIAYHDADVSNNGGQYRSEGVDIEGTTDDGGGYDIAYTTGGEWLRYTVDVASTGLYTLGARVASAQPGGFFHAEVDGKNVTGIMKITNTWWWQNWTTLNSPSFTISAGRHDLRLVFDGNGEPGNLNWLDVEPVVASTPFYGAPAAIPGKIEIEDFDRGGEGVAYFDVDSWNNGGQYRNDEGVDIEGTGDVGGGYDIGWSQVGEWLNYTVDIAAAGTYTVHVRAASPVPGGGYHLALDGQNITGSWSLPGTDAWQNFVTTDIPNIELPKGRHVLQLVLESDGYWGGVGNFNWISVD